MTWENIMLLRQKSTESISCLLREHTYYQGTVLNTICHWWDKDARSQVHRPMADPAPLEDCMSYNFLGLRSSFQLHSMSIAPPSCSNFVRPGWAIFHASRESWAEYHPEFNPNSPLPVTYCLSPKAVNSWRLNYVQLLRDSSIPNLTVTACIC